MKTDSKKKIETLGYSRLSISPRKQLWIKAVKKLTSERLGRESLAAWEDSKSGIELKSDVILQELEDRTKKSSDASNDTDLIFPGQDNADTDKDREFFF